MTDGQFQRHCVRMLVEPIYASGYQHGLARRLAPLRYKHFWEWGVWRTGFDAGEAEAAYCSEVIAEWMSNRRRTAPGVVLH